MKTHTVKKGDTLWGIAKTYLGDGARYKEIQKLNNLKEPVIYPGMVLKIPSESKSNYEEIGKAFEKALKDVDNLPSVNALYDMVEDL